MEFVSTPIRRIYEFCVSFFFYCSGVCRLLAVGFGGQKCMVKNTWYYNDFQGCGDGGGDASFHIYNDTNKNMLLCAVSARLRPHAGHG